MINDATPIYKLFMYPNIHYYEYSHPFAGRLEGGDRDILP